MVTLHYVIITGLKQAHQPFPVACIQPAVLFLLRVQKRTYGTMVGATLERRHIRTCPNFSLKTQYLIQNLLK